MQRKLDFDHELSKTKKRRLLEFDVYRDDGVFLKNHHAQTFTGEKLRTTFTLRRSVSRKT